MSAAQPSTDSITTAGVTPVVPVADDSAALGSDFDWVVVCDKELSAKLIQERQARGADHHDEVWEGVYMMSPLADVEHQEIIGRLTMVFGFALAFDGRGTILPGVNVSDRDENWKHNFRIPDLAVYLKNSATKLQGAFANHGPDFAVEVVSKNDRTREKLDFYAKVGVRELLIVDRDPWQLELLRLEAGKLSSIGTSSVEQSETLSSDVIPFTLKLESGDNRPAIAVRHTESKQVWRV